MLETLFRAPPAIHDALTYAHGPFQLDCVQPGVNWLFTSVRDNERDLRERLEPLFRRGGALRILESPLPPPLAVFAYEAMLNRAVLAALDTAQVDLVDWPGKGEDGAGYGIRRPGPTIETKEIL